MSILSGTEEIAIWTELSSLQTDFVIRCTRFLRMTPGNADGQHLVDAISTEAQLFLEHRLSLQEDTEEMQAHFQSLLQKFEVMVDGTYDGLLAVFDLARFSTSSSSSSSSSSSTMRHLADAPAFTVTLDDAGLTPRKKAKKRARFSISSSSSSSSATPVVRSVTLDKARQFPTVLVKY